MKKHFHYHFKLTGHGHFHIMHTQTKEILLRFAPLFKIRFAPLSVWVKTY